MPISSPAPAARRDDSILNTRRSASPRGLPDGGSLVFWAQNDLLVALPDGGTAPTGIAPRLAKAGIGSGPFADAEWTLYGLIFSARTGFARNIYRCPIAANGKATGDIVPLTNGTQLMGDASVSRDGRVALFQQPVQRFDIWGLALDGDTGKVTGPPYRITDTLAPTSTPDLSTDGKRAALRFFAQRILRSVGEGPHHRH